MPFRADICLSCKRSYLGPQRGRVEDGRDCNRTPIIESSFYAHYLAHGYARGWTRAVAITPAAISTCRRLIQVGATLLPAGRYHHGNANVFRLHRPWRVLSRYSAPASG